VWTLDPDDAPNLVYAGTWTQEVEGLTVEGTDTPSCGGRCR
jgi:hypothetical protein